MTSAMQRIPKPRLVVQQNRVCTTSLAVAEFFGKLHKNVLRDIEALLRDCRTKISWLKIEPRDSAAGVSSLNSEEPVSVTEAISQSNSGLADAMLRQFCQSNFEPTLYVDSRGKTQPMYLLTKNGFVVRSCVWITKCGASSEWQAPPRVRPGGDIQSSASSPTWRGGV